MKWQYKVVYTHPKYRAGEAFENDLNNLGQDGWDLVGTQENALYFKRPDPEYNKRVWEQIMNFSDCISGPLSE